MEGKKGADLGININLCVLIIIFNIKQTNTQTDFFNTFTEMQPTIVIGELVPMTTSKSISPKSQTTISTTATPLITNSSENNSEIEIIDENTTEESTIEFEEVTESAVDLEEFLFETTTGTPVTPAPTTASTTTTTSTTTRSSTTTKECIFCIDDDVTTTT